MRKFLVLAAATIAAIIAVYLVMSPPGFGKKNYTLAGGEARDFILGMKNSVTYSLFNLLPKHTMVLMFTDRGANSEKLEKAVRQGLPSLARIRPGLMFFSIKKDGSHVIMEEQTSVLSLLYRAPLADLPDFYHFKNLPCTLVIDKSGTIKLVYSGYSPTVISDISLALAETAK
jgi:hypothetical protein